MVFSWKNRYGDDNDNNRVEMKIYNSCFQCERWRKEKKKNRPFLTSPRIKWMNEFADTIQNQF